MKSNIRTKDMFVLLFAGSIYFSALVVNSDALNISKLYGFGSLVVLYFLLRVNGGTGEQIHGKTVHTFIRSHVYPKFSNLQILKFSNAVKGMIIIWGLFEAILGLLQLYGYMPSKHSLFRLTGTFFNPGPYAGFLAVVAPLALYYLLNTKNTKDYTENTTVVNFVKKLCVLGVQIICVLALVTIVLVLPATMSRAAWLAAVGGIFICVNGYTGKRMHGNTGEGKKPPLTPPKEGNFPFTRSYVHKFTRNFPVHTKLSVVVLIISACVGMYFLKKDSADGRLLTWKISLQTVVKHPLGVGLGNFSGAYGDVQAAYFAAGKGSEQEEYVAGNPEYGFNEYLQILVESGIVSFLLFMAIIILSIRLLLKSNAGMAGSLVALLIFACFSYPFSLWEFLLVFTFLIGVNGNTGEREKKPPLTPPKEGNFPFTRSSVHTFTQNFTLHTFIRSHVHPKLLMIAGLGLFLIIKQIPYYKAYKEWKKSEMLYHSGLYEDVNEAYKPLYPYLKDRTEFLFEYGRSLSQSEQYAESDKVLQRAVQISCDPMLYNIMGKNRQALKDYSGAEQCFRKAANIVPNRLYPYYLLMKLYAESGQQIKAQKAAQVVLTKEPKVHSQAIEEMRREAKKLLSL